MCDFDANKGKSNQIQILIQAAHESEKNRIINLILQQRDKVDFSTDEGMGAWNALTDILNKLQK